MSKIMRVYYDNAGLPYKDSALSTLYPIVGNEFTGANNTTEVHFYCENMGQATWVANCKLPNGDKVNRLLVSGVDNDGQNYQNLPLDSQLTSVVGHLKIGLNGYAGNISIDEEELENNDLVVISGTPTIIASGIIDIAMNYSPIVIPVSELAPNEYQELLALIGNKIGVNDTILVASDVSQLLATNYNNGQIIFDKATLKLYQVENEEFVLVDTFAYTDENNEFTGTNIFKGNVYKGEEETDSNAMLNKREIIELVDENSGAAAVPNNQMTVSYITDPITNTNGYFKNGYAYVGLSGGSYRITYNGESLTEEQARDYMQYMCGSRFLPHYDYANNKPQYTYFVIDNTVCFQVQYDGSDLVLVRKESLFELKTNKVNEVNVHSTNTQYPSARCLYNNIKNVTELAEGKTKTYVLSYATTGLDRTAPADFYYKPDGTAFTSWEEIDEYIGSFALAGGCGNPLFNSQADDIDVYDKYLITITDTIIVPYKNVNVGDIILVVETDVPDRWAGVPTDSLYKLETSKIDLTSYYTKTETNNLLNNYYTKTETNSLLTGYVSLAGNQTITGVKEFSNGLSTTSIKGVATMTQAQYDALVSAGTVDADTFYFIEEE